MKDKANDKIQEFAVIWDTKGKPKRRKGEKKEDRNKLRS